MSDDQELSFAAEFPAASREAWLELVSGVLKGAPFERRLVSKTYDGLAIEPLYSREAAARPVVGRSPGAPWRVMTRIEHPDPAAANSQALHDLENGATGLSLVFAGSIGAYGFGIENSEAALARVLRDIHLDAGISLDLQADGQPEHVAAALSALLAKRGTVPTAVDMRFGFDPLGIAATGGPAPPWDQNGARFAARFAAEVTGLAAQGFKGPFAVADGRAVHNAAGSEAQELAFAIAVALAYLRALEASGVPLDEARRMIYFRLAADADQFMTTAKFRALRKLWARIEEACGLAPQPAFVAAETAWRMMTQRDPFVNVLRSTMAVVAAGLGGADSITVLPHTAAIGLPDGFARRIARNTQLILLEESNLAKVADPSAGSGGFESLTNELCLAAWALFQEIEQAGGAGAALRQGLIQAKVAAVRAERDRAIARRKDALTGTSEFPDIAETAPPVLEMAPTSPAGRASGVALPCPALPSPALPSPALPRHRLAEPFEALRDAADRAAKARDRPKVFLANLGPLAEFSARATYAKNFFEAGGIAAVTNDGFASRDEMATAFEASGAALACLCSSDEIYAGEAEAAAQMLRAAGAKRIFLAGRPGAREAALAAAGIGGFIHVGCDVVATLRAVHSVLGIA
ncbi:MAG TPA: methylmalonyl-CoA mutase family protein [Xanthobacteraceae bacterium]|nr:methylmalonyl-CoA mutase family protein [Xanthobacteraceae bacterium]